MTGQSFCQNPVFGDDDEAAVVTRASDPEGLGAVGAGHRGVGDRRKRQQDDEDGDDAETASDTAKKSALQLERPSTLGRPMSLTRLGRKLQGGTSERG